MSNEHLELGDNMLNFEAKIYLDTVKEIIKEHSKEVAMNIKTQRGKFIIGGGVIGVALVAVIASVILNSPAPGEIPLFSTVEEAKAISKDTKEKCLEDNAEAEEAIKQFDFTETHEYDGKEITYSTFGTEAVSGFQDIPAGTDAEVTINSFDGTTAKGSVLYPQDYGTYTYTVEKLDTTDPSRTWKLTSLRACQL
jgi:hypothetical protein